MKVAVNTNNHPAYAIFKQNGDFYAFGNADSMRLQHAENYDFVLLSDGQQARLGELTDGDNHINATARRQGVRAVILAY